MSEMDEEDHGDITKILQSVDKKDVPADLLLLWQQQLDITNKATSKANRWHPRIMKLCIELYSKNPHVLDPLREFLYLPSNRAIRYHKNKTEQKPGWNRDMLHWCLQEATSQKRKAQDFWGGLVLDEMKIQENVEMVIRNGKHRLEGFVDLGEIHDDMETLSGKFTQPTLASYMLQFIFLGDNEFRFPIAQFPSAGCTHNFKKIRNNLLKSSLDGSRCLTVHGKCMVWEQLHNSYKFDQGEFSMSYNETLTAEHFELDPAAKIRNHLAEEVLDKGMLLLMKAYKAHLQSKGQYASSLDSTIEFLDHTSQVIELFHDKQPITSIVYGRLHALKKFLDYLENWKAEVVNPTSKKFLSYKLWFDLRSMILGFQSLTTIKLRAFPQSVIKPALFNQDVVENHFCQVRACNGQNNNPTYRLQEAAQNSIRFGQTTISRKSNAGHAGRKGKSN